MSRARVDSESCGRPGARRRAFTRAGAMLLFVVGIIAGAQWVRASVDDDIAQAESPWVSCPVMVPAWIPAGFAGALAPMEELPGRIDLRTPYWRSQIERGLMENPWVESVEDLERSSGEIRYRVRIARPVVGVRAVGGYLLLDSCGSVIDIAAGDRLDDAWGIPEYRPDGGPEPMRAPGTYLGREEYRQLIGVMSAVAEAGVLERWPGLVREIICDHGRDTDRFWLLLLARDVRVEWGRSPASSLPEVTSSSAKVESLMSVLEVHGRLVGGEIVEIFCDEPVVRTR